MPKKRQVLDETTELKKQLAETEETLEAIRQYMVDAFVVRRSNGEQVVTLTDANFPYRMMVEAMNEGAVTMIPDGTIFYSNPCFNNMVGIEAEKLIGINIRDLILADDQPAFDAFFSVAGQHADRGEFRLRTTEAVSLPVQLSVYKLTTTEDAGGIAILATDISERIRAEEKIRSLASELTLVEQVERHRISQILHDDLQQRLFAIRAHLALLKYSSADGQSFTEQDTSIDQIQNWLLEAINITRNLSINISPVVLRGDGLAEATSWLASQMHEQYGLQVEVEANEDFNRLEEHMRVLLFQAIREFLFNIVKHAGVQQATVRLAYENNIGRIIINDSGKGFDVSAIIQDPQAAHGLLIVKDRLGLMGCALEIVSQPGSGTQITISVPLENISSS